MMNPLVAGAIVGTCVFIVLFGLAIWIAQTTKKPVMAESVAIPQDIPTTSAPFPSSPLEDLFRGMIQRGIQFELRGRSSATFDYMPDAVIAMELIARGWVAYKPSEDLKKV